MQSFFSFILFITNLWIGEPKVNLNKVKDKHRGITSSIVLRLENHCTQLSFLVMKLLSF